MLSYSMLMREIDDCHFLEERLHEILSRHARQQTPKPGSSALLLSLPTRPQEYLLSKPIGLKRVASYPHGENEAVDQDKVL